MRLFSDIAAKLISRALCLYLRLIGRSLRVTIHLPGGSFSDLELYRVVDFVDAQRQTAPTLYVLWTSDHLNLLSLGFASDRLRNFARSFRFFTDDSMGGMVMRSAVQSLGAPNLPISQRDPADRLTLLRSVIETRTSAFLVVDGRGPYFQVGTGVINLAKAMGAAIVPCSITVRPRLIFPHRAVRIDLPLPCSHVELSLGRAHLFCDPLRSAKRGAGELRAALMQLRTPTMPHSDNHRP